jgi:adenosylmethionine-8-amino-7-oxononanoate aminotransferase
MDGALKLARQFFYEQGKTSRVNIVSRRQGYHGSTIGAMSVSSNLPRKIPYQPIVLQNVTYVSPAFAYHYQLGTETENEYTTRLIAELDAEFIRIGPETVIAFIAETVVGATSGCTVAPRGYFSGVRRLCDKYGILLILDEVMCGTGRTGTFFAFEQEGDDVKPDIMTLGKCLGGGYAPIAGILVGKQVMDVMRAGTGCFNHGHTYQAHPVSCAIALEVQKIMKRENLVEKCRAQGVLLGELLKSTFAECKYVGDVRGKGMFWAMEFVRDRETKESFNPSLEFGQVLYRKAFELGLAVYPCVGTFDGVNGDHVVIAPPYVIVEEELKEIIRILKVAYDYTERFFDAKE